MRRTCLLALLLLSLPAAVACSHSSVELPPAVRAVIVTGNSTRWMTTGDDPWEVFVCHVPADTRSAVYAGLPIRLSLEPDGLATLLNTKVSAYFDTLSRGAYRPQFTAGGVVTIAVDAEPQDCVDIALASASDAAHGVIAIADAEHNETQPGGFANPGGGCTTPPCPASATRRSVYVGAADFGSQWGDRPPMDLVEHELGHALGWPHSGYDDTQSEPNRSALDLMSNSAAPRLVHPDRRDGPDTLAINRLAAGWLPSSAVVAVPSTGRTVTLAPSNGPSGTRLVVVAVDDHRFITIELLTAEGFDDHLPASGVAVHLIEGSSASRTQTPLVAVPPYDDLLGVGETFVGDGWSVAVGDGWTTTIRPTGQPTGGVPTVSS